MPLVVHDAACVIESCCLLLAVKFCELIFLISVEVSKATVFDNYNGRTHIDRLSLPIGFVIVSQNGINKFHSA